MRNRIPIPSHIEYLELKLAKYKFVLENIPDAEYSEDDDYYCAKSISQNFSNVKIDYIWRDVWMIPFTTLKFYNEEIKIHSIPGKIKLAVINHVTNPAKPSEYHQQMDFCKYKFNTKGKFGENILGACQNAIVNFLTENSEIKVNYDNVDPRLKKVLMFL